MRRVGQVLVVLAIAAVASTARADDGGVPADGEVDVEAADAGAGDEAADAAHAAMVDERYADAARAYEAAFAADPDPDLALGAARAYDRAGRCDRAALFYEWYLEGGGRDHEVRRVARDRIAACAPPVAPARRTRHYGSQVAAVDALAVVAALVGAAGGAPAVLVGGALYVIGGPAVHLHHHNPRGAGLSLLTRVVVPLGVAFGGAKLETSGGCRSEFCGLGGFVLGGGLGMLTAMVIDWSALAKTTDAPAVVPVASVGARGEMIVGIGATW